MSWRNKSNIVLKLTGGCCLLIIKTVVFFFLVWNIDFVQHQDKNSALPRRKLSLIYEFGSNCTKCLTQPRIPMRFSNHRLYVKSMQSYWLLRNHSTCIINIFGFPLRPEQLSLLKIWTISSIEISSPSTSLKQPCEPWLRITHKKKSTSFIYSLFSPKTR